MKENQPPADFRNASAQSWQNVSPKKRKMTAEEKQKVKNTAFGMLNESKEEIITEAFTEAVEDMAGEIEDRITEE